MNMKKTIATIVLGAALAVTPALAQQPTSTNADQNASYMQSMQKHGYQYERIVGRVRDASYAYSGQYLWTRLEYTLEDTATHKLIRCQQAGSENEAETYKQLKQVESPIAGASSPTVVVEGHHVANRMYSPREEFVVFSIKVNGPQSK